MKDKEQAFRRTAIMDAEAHGLKTGEGTDMPGRNPRPGDRYRHFKGNLYQIIAIAQDAETEKPCVVYQALYGEFKTYVRAYTEFIGKVDTVKYPNAGQAYRFTFVEEEAQDSPDFSTEAPTANSTGALTAELEAASRFETLSEKQEEAAKAVEMHELKNPEDEGEVNPDLLLFLEAEGNREKLAVLESIRSRMNDSILCAIEASMDIIYEGASVEERIDYIRNFLKTKEQYEGARLR